METFTGQTKVHRWERSSVIAELLSRNFICKEMICIHARTHTHTPVDSHNCNLTPLQLCIYYNSRI